MAAPSSLSSSGGSDKYDVFINFRGEDTRRCFVCHLYEALKQKALDVFIDSEELRKDEYLSGLFKAIQGSSLSIIVFSTNYASSKRCLKELAQILECKDRWSRVVVPIFYEVDPSHVRNLEESFAEAFAEHESNSKIDKEELESWKSSLRRASNLSGYYSRNYQDDNQLIGSIVEDIFQKLIHISPSETHGLVGMDSHMDKIDSLLQLGVDDFRIVGILGVEGIGKSTIARAVFERIARQFEHSCFLDNVREGSIRFGAVQMVEKFLSVILRVNDRRSLDGGLNMIRERLRKKKILLVLDDVDNLHQIETLIGEKPTFGGGSRIIITTRDKKLLAGFLIYEPRLLTNEEALELFRRHAFRTNKYSQNYDAISRRAVEYAHGLPLALKVLGALLDNKTVQECEYELEKIEQITTTGVVEAIMESIFYEVDPSYVHYLKESFAQVFAKHESLSNVDKEELESWKSSLRRAINLSDWGSRKFRDDTELIGHIVEDMFKKLIHISPTKTDWNAYCYASTPRKIAASLPSSVESSSFSAHPWTSDVFFSADTLGNVKGFTFHLYRRLLERGIKTFWYDSGPGLEVGDDISRSLLMAVEGSRLAIVVLSQYYAFSTLRLEKLTKICQFMEDGHRILPVFYEVNPSDVRNQKGSFQDAITKHEKSGQYDPQKVQQWRDAVRKVASLSGWLVQDFKIDKDLVEAIVDSVYRKLHPSFETFIEIEPKISQEIAVSLPSSAEPSSTAQRWKYDVFLSYRGGDTPMNFIPDFYDGLQKRGIKTFTYDRDTREYVHYPIFRAAIEESRHAVLVLTEKYACSTWSLEELTMICECMKDRNRILPVFYNVKPSDIQYRKRSFGEAFDKHESSGRHTSDKVKRWKDVLNHVASLSGWHTILYKTDRELVDNILDFVYSEVHRIEIEFTMSTGDFEAFESTRKAMKDVMKALTDDEVTIVGVYGKGGVGKTTMVEHVSEAVKNNGMFHHVITVVVSRSPDLRKIQGTLADLLGVILEDETEIGRSRRLMQKIRRGNRILIILDDIWERIDLTDIGIPSCHELQRCNSKVLLTTRIQNVCHVMECQSNISLDVLSEADSWTLFVNKTKQSFEPTIFNFYDVAREVARDCAGLPVALIAVANALVGKCLDDWKEAARRLRASQTANPEDEEFVFSCLKLSYDYLKSDDAKSCFLLCCLFPEDYDIQIEDLLKYGMGKGLFQDVTTMHDARASAYSVVKYLKDCGLLLKSEQDGCVKMHDVIRDVAIRISSSEDGPLFFVQAGCQLKEWPSISAHEGYSAISLIRNKICKLPEELVCPKLLILFLQSNVCLNEIPEHFFRSLNVLRVLDLSRTRISLLPTSFNLLMNLHTLYLDGCLSIINNISALGSLEKLEILSMRDLPLVELPKELGHLSNLRMLDITGEYVDIVPSEVICNLHSLEELYMQCTFADWRSKVGRNEVNESKVAEAGEENIAAFDELTSLSNLNILKVFISDAKCLPKHVEFQLNWINFDICISRNPSVRKVSLVSSSSPAYTRVLTLGTTINALPYWFIDVVTRKAEKLQYIMCWGLDNIIVEYHLGSLDALKYLSVIGPNENLKVLMKCFRNEPVFQNLEELHLIQVDSLMELCVGELPPGSLCNLRLLKVKHCYELVDALLSSQLLQRLQNLEKLICEEMDELEYVFGCEGLKPEHIILPELKEMRLENLGKLIKIWNGPAPCAIFQNLQSLVVSGCFELENLFTADVAQCLRQLEDLSVELCPLLDRVIEASKETIYSKIVFPELKNLALIKLPQLTRFYGNTGSAIECPLLEYLYVERCPQFSTPDFHSRNKVQLNHQ